MASEKNPESLGSGYYWVGSRTVADRLQCNPYLLIEGTEAVLFDPGSALDFEDVKRNILSICPLERIRYIVLHHHDPGLASSVPLFEAQGVRAKIVCHWRTWSVVRFYGLSSPPYLVDEMGNNLILETGRRLQFVATPYLPYPGSMATFDKQSKVLLSGLLFGAFQSTWALSPDKDHMEMLKSFHEHFMPSNEILRPIMELFATLPISLILPHQGPVIDKDISQVIQTLTTLDCGRTVVPPRNNGSASASYRIPAELLLARCAALFGHEDTIGFARSVGLGFDPIARRIVGEADVELEHWDKVAEQVFLAKGPGGLSLIEPFIANLCHDFSINRPSIFDIILQKSLERYDDLGEEVARLKELSSQLIQSSTQAQHNLMIDAVTGLNNEGYFRSFIEEQSVIAAGIDGEASDILAVVGIDEGMARIEYQYGPKEVEAILKGVARYILDIKKPNHVAFRLHGATFALWVPHMLIKECVELCETLRRAVEVSRTFIEPVTISIGLVAVSEMKDAAQSQDLGSAISDLGIRRLRIARKRGGNTICASSEIGAAIESKGKILVVDDDPINAEVIKTFLENADFQASVATDGDEAMKKISEEGFDIIITELMIPKIDGFMLKESLLRRSGTKDIPFILMSHLKDESNIVRAFSLGVDYYLKKPFLLAELMGVVKKIAGSGGPR
jgi:PleD family two-component response regulator/glyoxylase-like metal-dependent hydrolase (beta-lactamase superfamily II)